MIKLTARLTLSNCVSQLTDFTTREILPELFDYGFQSVLINLCDDTGEVLPFQIHLNPVPDRENPSKLIWLEAEVSVNCGTTSEPLYATGYDVRIYRLAMSHRQMFATAAHTCGDYIKFYTKKGL